VRDWIDLIGKNGGADRDRTDDPLLAKQMLSQLSYSPGSSGIEDEGLRIEDFMTSILNPQFSIPAQPANWWA
jgi:hypothetical protein